ncbi:PREDICTED: pre-mRNA-processing protein 40A-like isoform X1 [Lupinus angustifolius]|uniref:pre-mRNA-processing protein 40A-like isoform X1 n=1 Tax=Lupinus angustifolius TaxID=3871 RepID=UPI00092E3104|nr:PREDICTED: pre-mRNA-processing protein 40A-like isoform X1 [Lupinus angustifolius]
MSNNPQFPGLQPLRPPIAGSGDPQRNFAPPMHVQYHHVVPTQQSQQFIPMPSQHYQPIGHGVPMINVGMPPQNPNPQFSQPIQQLPPRHSQPMPLPPQAIPLPVARPNMHMSSEQKMAQADSQAPNVYTSGLGGPGMPLSSSYTFAPSSYGQMQTNFVSTGQYQSVPQVHAHTGSSQSITSGTIIQSNGEQPSVTNAMASAISLQPPPAMNDSTDWIEHTSATGRRFYYNKKTKLSSWEKPYELMTLIERVDASTNWKQYSSPDGRKYYYNKVTKESKWLIPEELKLARAQVEKAAVNGTYPEAILIPHSQPSASPQVVEATPGADISSLTVPGDPTSPVSVAPVGTTFTNNLQPEITSGSPASPSVVPQTGTKVEEVEAPGNTVKPSDAGVGRDGASVTDVNTAKTLMDGANNTSVQYTQGSADGVPAEDKEDGKTDSSREKTDDVASETKVVEPEPLVYVNKMGAKDAFKALLESVNVGSDWTWDRAMRVIINDKRYGALKTLGERKQAFNEYLNQRKKQEVEEKRMKQKKAREDFKKMLEESTELTSSTRWSKAVPIFENDERFKALERDRDRRDVYDSFMEDFVIKERARAQVERKQNLMEFRMFLESCDFIKASTQWRKVQDRIEADERCSRLEKIDRLEIFQDYLHDLAKEEEEQKKIQKEELRKTERKNRDEFRKLMEEHVAAGILTAKTNWRDYHSKVKDLPAYVAAASNTSGSIPKDLFEDVVEELEKQYNEEKSRIKDAVKLAKITLSSNWNLEDFKSTISKDISSPPVSEFNLKLVFDELLERAKEKEEKEAKKRKRLADDFFHLLSSIKDMTASSKWEDYGPLIEDSQEFRSIGDENLCKGLFEEYIIQLKEETIENERKRKEEKVKKEKDKEEIERRKGKQRREKEGGREREKGEAHVKDKAESDGADKRSEDGNRKRRKQHRSPEDISHEKDKDRSKKSHGHSSSRKKSRRQHGHESDESRHKRHKREHRSDSHREGDHGNLEGGEHGDSVVDRW